MDTATGHGMVLLCHRSRVYSGHGDAGKGNVVIHKSKIECRFCVSSYNVCRSCVVLPAESCGKLPGLCWFTRQRTWLRLQEWRTATSFCSGVMAGGWLTCWVTGPRTGRTPTSPRVPDRSRVMVKVSRRARTTTAGEERRRWKRREARMTMADSRRSRGPVGKSESSAGAGSHKKKEGG